MKITKSFFNNKDTLTLTQELIWKVIVRKTRHWIIKWIINETECYTEEDEASHSFEWKITNRNDVMFRESWYLYVYLIYWVYHCMNIVTEKSWYGSAVLVRSILPFKGKDIMIKNRNLDKNCTKNLCNWPWKVCLALWINNSHNWLYMLDNTSEIYLEDIYKIPKIKISTRIGINKATNKLWRFYF